MDNFKIICKKCGAKAVIKSDNDGGCDDPDCCGGRDYWFVITCPVCGEETEEILNPIYYENLA